MRNGSAEERVSDGGSGGGSGGWGWGRWCAGGSVGNKTLRGGITNGSMSRGALCTGEGSAVAACTTAREGRQHSGQVMAEAVSGARGPIEVVRVWEGRRTSGCTNTWAHCVSDCNRRVRRLVARRLAPAWRVRRVGGGGGRGENVCNVVMSRSVARQVLLRGWQSHSCTVKCRGVESDVRVLHT
jgi:hypothetical protein